MYCPKCGVKSYSEDVFCRACGASLNPPSLKENITKMDSYKGNAVLYKLSYAGFWKRFWALLIDGIILGPLLFYFRMLAATTDDISIFIKVYILTALAVLFYFSLMESSRYQATPGKMILGIVVTDLQGGRISFWRALGRNLGKIISDIILFIGFIIAGFTEKKQALHDIMAKCVVIDKSSVPVQPRSEKKCKFKHGQKTFFMISVCILIILFYCIFIFPPFFSQIKLSTHTSISKQEEATPATESNAILSNTSNLYYNPAPPKKEVIKKAPANPKGYFTIGSSKDEVEAIQGSPGQTSTIGLSGLEGDRWRYGSSSVQFNAHNKVNEYFNNSGELRIKIVPKTDVSKALSRGYFTTGSSKDEVIALHGTPNIISKDKPTDINETWYYEGSSIKFHGDKVVSCSGLLSNLKFKFFKEASKKSDVSEEEVSNLRNVTIVINGEKNITALLANDEFYINPKILFKYGVTESDISSVDEWLEMDDGKKYINLNSLCNMMGWTFHTEQNTAYIYTN